MGHFMIYIRKYCKAIGKKLYYNQKNEFKFLSKCLTRYHKQKVIILIDEYDVPLENAYFSGFYDEMTAFIRSLMESALKTNECLKFAVITGCLRISKESIFTGLNNLNILSVLSNSFAEYFGFMETEVMELIAYYELEDKAEEVKQWYDGYLFGQTRVYNPWSVINYLNGIVVDKIAYPRPYWVNTSSNHIVKQLIEKADDTVKAELEDLMSGKTISKQVHEDITYEDIHSTQDNFWNFLFFTGYLKAVDIHFDGARAYMTSNRETGDGRADLILKPFDEQRRAVIIELKYVKEASQLEAGCGQALNQIEGRHYVDELLEDGYQHILKYGICFHKKNCRVKCE